MAEEKRAKHISERKRQQIAAHIFLRHAVKAHQHERVSKKDRVVEESLRQHQNKSEQRALSMFVHNCFPNFSPRRMRTRVDSRRRRVMRGQSFGMRYETVLNVLHDSFRLSILPVNHEPARTFRNPTAKEDHDQTQCCADSKRTTPAQPNRQPAW